MVEVSEPLNPSPERTSVLLVDDTPANLLSLRAILDDLNQHLVEARSGEEALERLKVEEFAVVLLDVLLPGLSGFETAKAIRNQERSRHTPIIFLTASDIDRSQIEEAYRLGAVDFLGKPLLPVAVRAKVRGFVELFQDKQKAQWEAEQLGLLVHRTADYAIFMLDPLGKVATWNTGAERIKQYKADEIIGQHFSKFYPQEAIDRGWPDHELKVATAEGRFEDEGWRIRKDGSQFWANVVITALRDEQGRLRGFSKVTRDLTERKEAEESLRRSEERFRHMVEGVQDYAIFMLDPHGNVATWNAGAERIKQYKAEEIIGQHFSKFYPQEALDRGWPAHELMVAAAEGRFEDEGWRVRKDGSQFWANVVITAITDGQGRLLGFTKVTRDLTERKKAEESARRLVEETTARRVAEENAQLIQEQRERLHVTLSSIGDAVISTDAEGRVEFLNPVAQELIGWGNEDASRRTLSDVFRIVNEKTRQPVENPALRALKEGVVVGLANHTVLISKDGRERPIDDSAAPIKDSQGCVVGSVLVFRDITEKRQAQERLRVQQEWLRVTLASIGDAVIATDAEGRVTFLNPVAEGLTGWPQAEAQGEPLEVVFNILNERTRQPVENPVGRVLREGVIVGLGNHTILVTRDGMERPIDDSAAPIRDATGKLIGVVLIFRDVTEQRRGQALLADSEKRLRLALDAGRMGVWDWNVRTGDLNWSDTLEPLYGLAPGTFGGTFEHFQQLVHPQDRETVNATIRESLEGGGEFSVEFRNLWPNGRVHWIAGSGKVFPGDDGRPLRMIGVGMDVTARRRAEQTARFLADASAALAVLVDFESTLQKVASLAVPYFADWVAVDMLESDGTLRRVAVAHIDPAKVQLAHDLHRHYPPDPAAPGGVWHILRTGQAEIVPEITDEMLMRSAKDEELLGIMRQLGLKSYIAVPLTVRGKTLGVLTFIAAESGHVYDDTDLSVAQDLANRAAIAIDNSQLYRELREADRRKDEFLAILAHELRNPLAPIRNGLQVLRLAGGGGEMVNEARSMMERQLSHMVRLVDDLLDVSRITRNKLELRKERVALATVIHTAVETSRPLIEQFGHTFSVTLTPTPVYLDADPVRLAQVFSNLLTNAAKYTQPGGRIFLTAEVHGAEAVVQVRDTGLGIPADALSCIFEMFSQVDRNIERAQGGLGIGLTLVRRLAEMHGGTVEAKSEGPGRGSEFVVRLPVLKDSRQRSEGVTTEEGRQARAKRRILVVDDNQDSATSLGMMLTLMGNEVRTAEDGFAAVEAAQEFRPDLILLDIGLPKLNGYDACRRIREQPWSEGMVIVALTGWGQEEDRKRSREAGFDTHMVKPVEIAALESLLAGLTTPR